MWSTTRPSYRNTCASVRRRSTWTPSSNWRRAAARRLRNLEKAGARRRRRHLQASLAAHGRRHGQLRGLAHRGARQVTPTASRASSGASACRGTSRVCIAHRGSSIGHSSRGLVAPRPWWLPGPSVSAPPWAADGEPAVRRLLRRVRAALDQRSIIPASAWRQARWRAAAGVVEQARVRALFRSREAHDAVLKASFWLV